MDTKDILKGIERNPKTHAQHRKEVFWQITLPLLVGILLVLAAIAAIIFSAVQPVTGVERWADVSLMWVILPSLLFALIILVIVVGLVVAFTYLLRLLPRYTLKVQHYFEIAQAKVEQITDKIAEPFIEVRGGWAGLRWASRRIRGLIDRNTPL